MKKYPVFNYGAIIIEVVNDCLPLVLPQIMIINLLMHPETTSPGA